MKQNPSLKNHEKIHDTFLHSYSVAILKAAKEANLDETNFPDCCEWVIEKLIAILADNFLFRILLFFNQLGVTIIRYC